MSWACSSPRSSGACSWRCRSTRRRRRWRACGRCSSPGMNEDLKQLDQHIFEEEVAVLRVAHRAALEAATIGGARPRIGRAGAPISAATLAREGLANGLDAAGKRSQTQRSTATIVTERNPRPEELHAAQVVLAAILADDARGAQTDGA